MQLWVIFSVRMPTLYRQPQNWTALSMRPYAALSVSALVLSSPLSLAFSSMASHALTALKKQGKFQRNNKMEGRIWTENINYTHITRPRVQQTAWHRAWVPKPLHSSTWHPAKGSQ